MSSSVEKLPFPVKIAKDSAISNLMSGEAKMLIMGSLCLDGKLDSEKLARLTGMKKASASAMYTRAKRRLDKLLAEENPAPTADGTPGASTDAKSGAAESSPFKERPTRNKRRKTKAASESPASVSPKPTLKATPLVKIEETETYVHSDSM